MSHHDPHGHHHHPPNKHWLKRFWWAVGVVALILVFVTFYVVNMIQY
ncbi:MAG: hypothetical protein ACREJC_23380 [Tepidisphaeraceae bacterium]